MSRSLSNDEESSNILVAVRIRPLSKKEEDSDLQTCVQSLRDQYVAIKKAGDSTAYLKSQANDTITEYAFDRAFGPSSTQKDVYVHTVHKFIPKLLDLGQNVTVFAYGATGAGKSFTMFGNSLNDYDRRNSENFINNDCQDDQRGIIARSLQELFSRLDASKNAASKGEQWAVSLSFCEVYNEQVFDLLEHNKKPLSIREDAEKGIVQIAGLSEVPIKNVADALSFLAKGQKYRKMEPTMANAVSSRSHAILQLTVRHTTPIAGGKERKTESKLSLIDLAGSERASLTNNRGIRLQEGANINRSLLALANCINALTENASHATPLPNGNESGTDLSLMSEASNSHKKVNVKYRDSKLTHLLKTSLEGNCNLVMIANVSPSQATYEDSYRTLLYAHRARNLKLNPTTKDQTLSCANISDWEKLHEENASLRNQLQSLQMELQMSRALIEELQSQLTKRNSFQHTDTLAKKSHSTEDVGSRRKTISPLHSGKNYQRCSISPIAPPLPTIDNIERNPSRRSSGINHDENIENVAYCANHQISFDGSVSPRSCKSCLSFVSMSPLPLNTDFGDAVPLSSEGREYMQPRKLSFKRPLEPIPTSVFAAETEDPPAKKKKTRLRFWNTLFCSARLDDVVSCHKIG